MKTNHYLIQEKYPESEWRTLSSLGKFPSYDEAHRYYAWLSRDDNPMKVKYRLIEVTEEVVCAS